MKPTTALPLVAVMVALAAGCDFRRSPPPRLRNLPVQMNVKQRTTTVVPGSDGKLRLTIDDITRGQVIASLVNAEGTAVLAATSLEQGDRAPFILGRQTYELRLRELNNALLGEDFATFEIAIHTTNSGDVSESAKIERLLSAIESAKDDVFMRNGAEYSGKEAADHLRAKWNAVGDKIATAEDFIDQIAAKSSLSGEPYRVRVANGAEIPAGAYLREKLAHFENGRN
jgi:hypothetical protein